MNGVGFGKQYGFVWGRQAGCARHCIIIRGSCCKSPTLIVNVAQCEVVVEWTLLPPTARLRTLAIAFRNIAEQALDSASTAKTLLDFAIQHISNLEGGLKNNAATSLLSLLH